MRNHFHLALETPAPNLVEGMHWLLGTFASRFNRWRDERGHLFQGQYHAPLVEDEAQLVRLINYIHLNPVEAGVVPAAHVGTFRWGSFKEARWREELAVALHEVGKTESDIAGDAKGAGWKVAVACRLRHRAQAPHGWIAGTLNMGAVSSVRSYLAREINK